MEKLYDRINWHNNTDPAINEANLNRMDIGIDAIDTRVCDLAGTITEDVPAIQEYLEQSEDLVQRIETMTKNPPYIGANGNWYVFNTNTMQYEDSGIDASITVEIADITMIPYIDAPYVTNSGTNTDPIFHLYIPRAATISSVEKTQIVGNVDTYTMTLQDGSTFNFTVTNGTGSGDMKAVDYDPQGTVASSGGIIAYGDQRLEQGLIEGTGHTHGTQSTSRFMHIEGVGSSVANGAKNIHVEGTNNQLSAVDSAHAEGQSNIISGGSAPHVEGLLNKASGDGAHAEGIRSYALAEATHAEGIGTSATFSYAHAEGMNTRASNSTAHSEGANTRASAFAAHAEGEESTAAGRGTHAEGYHSSADGEYSHTEGYHTETFVAYSHAEGISCFTNGSAAHAEGENTHANGAASHSEGGGTISMQDCAHAEGSITSAYGVAAHAEGYCSLAQGIYSHAEGNGTTANGLASHAEGSDCVASSQDSHAGGNGSSALSSTTFAHGNKAQALYPNSIALGYEGIAYNTGDSLTNPRLFAIGSQNGRNAGIYNTLTADSTDVLSDIYLFKNMFSIDLRGNTFMRGAPFTAKGVLYNRLIADGDYYVLEDGAAYVLWTNTRMINNNAWRGAQAYYIVSPFSPHALGEGASTTALAVAQHHQFSTIGTAGLTLKKDTVSYVNEVTGATCYHARIGIGSCVANCCVRYTLIKILGSELDMMSFDS